MTGAFIKKVVIDKFAEREVIGTMGKMDVELKCSSLDGMTNVYRVYDGTTMNYYLIDFSAEPYIKPMMNETIPMSKVIGAEFCFFSDK